MNVMQTPPTIAQVSLWVSEHQPLDIGPTFTVKDIDPKPFSGHFNFLIIGLNQKFILRFKGPEWGRSEGIKNEYEMLRELDERKVGPRMYGFTDDFFGEPASFMEHLNGVPFSVSNRVHHERFPDVVDLIVRINSVDVDAFPVHIEAGYTSYREHVTTWRERLEHIQQDERLTTWASHLETLLPRAELMLEAFEPVLEDTLEQVGSSFIFASAHAGHCLVTPDGLRFINWEKVCAGDPSFTLAVFLASIEKLPDFPEVKQHMITQYLERRPVPNFERLVEQRLKERAVSNLTWALDNYSRKPDETRPPEEATGIVERCERVSHMLEGL